MRIESNKWMCIAGVIAVVLATFQLIFLTRYMSRLSDDTLGVWLYVLTIILWISVAILFFQKSRSERSKHE